MVGLDKVPAIILDKPLGLEETLETRLIENLHRKDVDPLDEAEAYKALKKVAPKGDVKKLIEEAIRRLLKA